MKYKPWRSWYYTLTVFHILLFSDSLFILFLIIFLRPGRGMKLGGKPKTNEFVDALIAEGDLPTPKETPSPSRVYLTF